MTRQISAFSWKSQSRMVFQFVEASVLCTAMSTELLFSLLMEGLVHILSLKLVCNTPL